MKEWDKIWIDEDGENYPGRIVSINGNIVQVKKYALGVWKPVEASLTKIRPRKLDVSYDIYTKRKGFYDNDNSRGC